MKARSFRRMLSAFLAVVMVLTTMPLSGIEVNAATTITTVNDMGKLGSGFNMLGDKYLGDAPMRQIFVSTSGITAQFDSNPVSKSSYSYITSVSDYFSNEAQTIKVGFGMGSEASAKLTIKIVELNLSQKYKLDFSTTNGGTSSSNTSDSTEYMLLEYMHQIGTYTMWLDNETQIARLWQTDANGNFTILNEDFVNSLLNDDPATFFKNYGSHLITQYTAGGTATSSYYGEIHYESSSESFEHNTSVSESAEGALSKHKELESIYSSNTGSSTGNTVKRGESTARGGTGNFAWDEASASSWATTVDKDHHIALVDDNLMMLPMWELLVDDSQADRRIELEQYFNENVDSQYAELYGKYIYSPTGNKDYTGYTFVQTAEDFNNIRNNLNGKYVLLNNIDLSSYTEWSPIGTKTAPFTGTIDGNGNTVSGLSISKCDSYAGLLGYNVGTVENLTVSGNIDADGSGSTNNVAYIGGIAGYNAGTIYNCRNMVTVNGKLTVTDAVSENVAATTNEFYAKYSAAIENAKKTTAQTLSNNSTVSVGLTPIHLTGTATGVTINVSGSASNDPAFIVLENTNITGTITHNSSRKICIISIGDSNSISGSASQVAINVSSADLYITGEANLNIAGGNGANGASGNNGTAGSAGDSRTDPGDRGTDGSNGGNGGNGAYGIVANSLTTNTTGSITIAGGDGGDGGNGGNGGSGGRGWNGNGIMLAANGSDAGDGGHGGNGGNGGNGQNALFITATDITILSGRMTIICGTSGNGGKGGNGGAGGRGGNANGSIGNAGNGGDGGNGGNGGNAGIATMLSIPNVKATYDAQVYATYTTNSYGIAGARGEAGSAGSRGSTNYQGSDGSAGTAGSAGKNETPSDTISDINSSRTILFTSTRKYVLLVGSSSWESAYQNAQSNDKTSLVSIGSLQEQSLVEELVELANKKDLAFWIGLKIISIDPSTQSCIGEWSDGSRIKIVGTGETAVAYRLDLDGNIVGEAYINFNAGEPNNSNNNEYFIHLTTDAKWNDNSNSAAYGYITETKIDTETGNTVDKNSLIIGGICGYNAGSIKSAYNTAKITANKAYSIQSGISAYVGGISGYNNGSIMDSANTGEVSALAVSDSMSHYADAYAYNIGKGGTTTNCSEEASPKANAYSANTLENTENGTVIKKDSVRKSVEEYWKNSELAINDITQTEYLRNSVFIRDTLNMSIGGQIVNAYTIRNNFYQYGTTTVTVTYSDGSNDYTRYIPIRIVEETPESVEIYMLPKTEFFIGDAFTSEGLGLKLVYNNGSEKLLSSKNFTVSAPNMSVAGKQTVTVSYEYAVGESYTCTYDITVSSISVVGIQVTKLPDKLSYFQGDKLDLNGIQVAKIYNNGQTELIPIDQLNATYNFKNAGDTTVTISFGNWNATYSVVVEERVVDEYTPQIIIESKKATKGKEVTVRVEIKNNPGISYLEVTPVIAPELTLVKVENGDLISDFTKGKQYVWVADEDVKDDGILMTFTFLVDETVEIGTYQVAFNLQTCANYDEEAVQLYMAEGNIQVIDFVYGDATGDGVVDGFDVIRLKKYLANYDYDTDTSTAEIFAGADATGDGSVDGFDVIRLKKYLANYDYETGESTVVLGPQ